MLNNIDFVNGMSCIIVLIEVFNENLVLLRRSNYYCEVCDCIINNYTIKCYNTEYLCLKRTHNSIDYSLTMALGLLDLKVIEKCANFYFGTEKLPPKF